MLIKLDPSFKFAGWKWAKQNLWEGSLDTPHHADPPRLFQKIIQKSKNNPAKTASLDYKNFDI